MSAAPTPAALLRALERAAAEPGDGAPARLGSLIASLARRPLPTRATLLRFHEILCFLRAYPHDETVLSACTTVLSSFDRRSDLRRFRKSLADTGIAGTDIHYQFFWFTAVWLAERWPNALEVDWAAFENAKDLEPLLRLLVPPAESEGLDAATLPPRRWIEKWRGGATDATFLVQRFASLHVDAFVREMLYERLDPPLRLRATSGTPSRSLARHPSSPVVFRARPLDRSRPDLRQAALVPPRAVRAVAPREARALIDLARAAMVTRSRDLDNFEHANEDDVRMIDCGDGLELACIGLIPERRALLDAIYGYLTLQNGVPIGYVLTSALFESALVAYNVFETFRNAEAARTYGRVLGVVRHLFGADTFAVDPYQLGHHNAEGLASGAWWFYFKLGFVPRDPPVQKLARAEAALVRTNRRHRSSRGTLQRLSAAHLFFSLEKERDDVLGALVPGRASLRISASIAKRFGADREAALAACAEEAAARFDAQGWKRFPAGERRAWEMWAPLLLLLPDVGRWSTSERADAVTIVRAKGLPSELDFVPKFDAHRRLRAGVRALLGPIAAA